MSNRRLTDKERVRLLPLLTEIRSRLVELASGDEALLWAFRRRLWKALEYDGRLKPPKRAALKRKKRAEQRGLCNGCRSPLPESGAFLDRHEAIKGYTVENTQLLCQACDIEKQRRLKYT